MMRGIEVFVAVSPLAEVSGVVRPVPGGSSAPNYSWVWWLVGALLLLVAAGIAFLIRRRRMQQPVDITDDIDRAAHHARVREVRDELAAPDDAVTDRGEEGPAAENGGTPTGPDNRR